MAAPGGFDLAGWVVASIELVGEGRMVGVEGVGEIGGDLAAENIVGEGGDPSVGVGGLRRRAVLEVIGVGSGAGAGVGAGEDATEGVVGKLVPETSPEIALKSEKVSGGRNRVRG